jgi:hypothetical protein
MAWIVAAVGADDGRLPPSAAEEFRRIAAAYPAAPWKIETGHIRSGRERLEQITGRSWGHVDLTPDQVREDVDLLKANAALTERGGLTAALVAFLEVCARHRLGLEGGEGARAMSPSKPVARRPPPV